MRRTSRIGLGRVGIGSWERFRPLPRRTGVKTRPLLGVALVLVAACSQTGKIDGPVLTSPRPSSGDVAGMAAEVTGVLVYDEATDCLWMELEGVRYPLIWPAGTRWQADPPAVVLTSGEKAGPGATVYGGGGYLYRDDVERSAGKAVAAAADRCTGPTGEIAFFNVGSGVEVLAD